MSINPGIPLGIVAKQSIVNSVTSYIGIGLGFLLTVFLYPNILNADQYGLTRVLISASLISVQFALLGLRNSIIRYFPFFRKLSQYEHGILFWAILIPLLGFLLFAVLFWIFQDSLVSFYRQESPLVIRYFLWILPLTLFILYFEVLNSFLRSLRDSMSGPLVNEVFQRVLVIGFLGLYFFDLIDFSCFVLLFALSYGMQPLILLFRIFKMGEFRMSPNFSILRKPIIKSFFNYGLYSFVGGLTTAFVWNIDIMMLGSMAGLANTAVYTIAFYIGSVIAVPQRSVERIATPLVADFIQKKEWGSVLEIYQKTSLNQLIAGLLIFGFIWINIDHVFNLLPDIYSGGKQVVFIIGVAKLFDLVTGINGSILVNSQHYRVMFYTNLLLVGLVVITNLLLIPVYGIAGAAVATAVSIFVYNSVKYIYVWLKLNLQPFSFNTLAVLFFGSFSFIISNKIFSIEYIFLDVAVRNILFLTLFLAPVIYFRISEDANRIIGKILPL